MTVRQAHLTANDWTRIKNDYFGRNVSLVVRTKTLSNTSGRESWTEATAKSIYSYFMLQRQNWWFDKSAQIQGGDAVLMSDYSDGVKKDDIIIDNGIKYIVKDIIHVPGEYNDDKTVTFVYSYCNLFIWDD